jgi:mono/diheme cytochrome c family protein
VRQPGQSDWVVSTDHQITTELPVSDLPPPPPLFSVSGVAALGLLILGLAALVFALFGTTRAFRKEAAGLGAAAIVAGVVLLLQARLPAPTVASAESAPVLAALDPGAVVRGQELFAQNCTTCHGAAGRGDGPDAASLPRPPADLTTGHAIPHADEDYIYWIENGIEGTGMPAFGGTLDREEVRDVVAYVRSLQQTALAARDAPGPELCTVAPRTLDEISALAQKPAPAEPPNATETGGAPADEATRTAIAQTSRELVACSNTGDILRRLALYSDNRLRYAYPQGPTRALEAIAKSPLPLTLAERVALVNVEDVRTLPDGRVSAKVTVENPANHSHDPTAVAAGAQLEVARLIFVKEAGRWRVDETRREDTRTNATPIAGAAGS